MTDAKVFRSPSTYFGQTLIFISMVVLLVSLVVGLAVAVPVIITSGQASVALLVSTVGVPVLCLVGMLVGMAVQGVANTKDAKARAAWLRSEHSGLFAEKQIEQLASGRRVYINDNGVTRDEVSFSDSPNDDAEGEILVFKQESAYRTSPTPVA